MPKKQIKTKRATVIIINDDTSESFTINPRYITAIKPIIFILFVVSVISIYMATSLWTKHANSAKKMHSLQVEVDDLKNFTSNEIEAKLQALNKSEQVILKMQAYLKKQGIKPQEVSFASKKTGVNDAAGGPEIKLSKPIPYIGEFSQQVDILVKQLNKVPFGRPHSGSLSSGFGPRFNPFTGRGGEFHGGLDFRGKTGEPIYTTADGTVDFSGVQRGYGNVVIVKHAHNFKTYYAHLSRRTVKAGDKVKVGDEVGKLGSTGRSTGPHLHYEVRINNERQNPKKYLSF